MTWACGSTTSAMSQYGTAESIGGLAGIELVLVFEPAGHTGSCRLWSVGKRAGDDSQQCTKYALYEQVRRHDISRAIADRLRSYRWPCSNGFFSHIIITEGPTLPSQPDATLLKSIDATLKTAPIAASLTRYLPQLKIGLDDIIFAPGSDRVLLLGSKAKEIDPKREIEFAKLICNTEHVHLLLTGMTEAIDGIAIERKTFVQLKDRTGADYNASRAMPVDEFIKVWGKTHGWSGVELYVRTQAPVAQIRTRWFMRGVQPEIDPNKHFGTGHLIRVVAYGADGHIDLPCQRAKWTAAGRPIR
jgi:hypothetical protein